MKVYISQFPSIEEAIKQDGVIRVVDGRWSGGFVDLKELQYCIDCGMLRVEPMSGMNFATLVDEEVIMNQVHPSKEILQPCYICGKRHIREDVDKWYYYNGKLICRHHPGAKEWYEMALKMADEELSH